SAVPTPNESTRADARKLLIAPFIHSSLPVQRSIFSGQIADKRGRKILTFLVRTARECQLDHCGQARLVHSPADRAEAGWFGIDFDDRDAKNGLPSWKTRTCYDSGRRAPRWRALCATRVPARVTKGLRDDPACPRTSEEDQVHLRVRRC